MLFRRYFSQINFVLLIVLFSYDLFGQNVDQNESIDDLKSLALKSREYNSDTSLNFAKNALVLAEQLEDFVSTAEMNLLIGEILCSSGNFGQGIEYLLNALTTYRLLGHEREVTRLNNTLARYYSESIHSSAAEKHVNEAIKESRRLGDPHLLTESLITKGYILERKNLPKQAIDFYQKADSINKGIEDPVLAKLIIESFASIYEDLGDYDRALVLYLETNQLVSNNSVERIDVLNNIGDIFRKNGFPDSAMAYYEKAFNLAQKSGNSRRMEQNLRDLALTYEAMGSTDKALEYFKRHMKVYFQIFNERSIASLNQMEILYGIDQKNKELELQKAKTQNRTLQRNVFLIILLVFSIVSLFLWYNARQKNRINLVLKKQRDKIEKQRSELAKSNEELNQLVQQVQSTQDQLVHSEKMATVGTLAAGIAHEINNPLNYIQGSIRGIQGIVRNLQKELKGSHESHEELENHFNNSIAGVEKATKIVKSLMTFSRKGNYKLQEIGVHYIVENALGMMRYDIPENVTIDMDIDDSVEIICYPEKIHHVLLNVLTNALHATIKSEVASPTIRIEARKSVDDQEKVEIHVFNTGNPIPKKQLDKVFDPFFTTKDPGTGTGLGLSTSYSVIKEHGGEISLRNIKGGVLCVMRLPITLITSADTN